MKLFVLIALIAVIGIVDGKDVAVLSGTDPAIFEDPFFAKGFESSAYSDAYTPSMNAFLFDDSDKIVKDVSSIYDFIMFREFGNENVAW